MATTVSGTIWHRKTQALQGVCDVLSAKEELLRRLGQYVLDPEDDRGIVIIHDNTQGTGIVWDSGVVEGVKVPDSNRPIEHQLGTSFTLGDGESVRLSGKEIGGRHAEIMVTRISLRSSEHFE